jgi:hypothetical protein
MSNGGGRRPGSRWKNRYIALALGLFVLAIFVLSFLMWPALLGR